MTAVRKIQSILVVDDNFDFRRSLIEFLKLESFDVTPAVDGDEGWRVFEKGSFDLVLTDIMMPNKAGFELIGDMVRLRPGQRIIAMTGGTKWISQFHLENATDMGANRVLQKPFSMKALVQAIRELEAEPEQVGEGE